MSNQPDVKYVVTKRFGITQVIRGADSFFRDAEGTLYAFREGPTADATDRCGVWPFALPLWPMFQTVNDACKPHDFAFSSPVYQAFHTYNEANEMLEAVQILGGHPVFGAFAEQIAAILGMEYWENKSTLPAPRAPLEEPLP